ncbi:MAG: low molecular weight phosphotyrosine protein phosphatase [Actinomycetota bacterium]|nr:low molecular weight phosphotyrosine protein phosphatase [Actinomycetota bacterium]
MRILLVCLGNICRSPTAEAALREALSEAGLADRVEVDSAGTGDWHLGKPPDRRMVAAAARVGLTVDGRARRIEPADFARFDLILAMDRSNLAHVRARAPDDQARAKVRLFREFEDHADHDEVPDPYYGGEQGFVRVVDIARAGARGLVRHLQERGV